MRLVLLGAPGSGKGTQATYITDRYGIKHVSTGDIFRENINEGTALGKKVKAIIDEGRLCPDELTVELVRHRLKRDDCKDGYLLDGFPRNLNQAIALDEFETPDFVINLNVDLLKIEKRITGRRSCPRCGKSYHIDFIGKTDRCPHCNGKLVIREDDTPETVKHRLAVYEQQTLPLVDFYKKQKKLYDVDGDLPIAEVFGEIVKILG